MGVGGVLLLASRWLILIGMGPGLGFGFSDALKILTIMMIIMLRLVFSDISSLLGYARYRYQSAFFDSSED